MNERVAAIVKRVLPASPEIVYDEWIDIDAFSDWMCPRPARPVAIDLEPRVGGRLRIDIEEDGRRYYVVGRYLVLDRPRHLSFTWSCSTWASPDTESVVSVTLEPRPGGQTLMTIEHRLLPDDLVAQHTDGWTRISLQLEAKLTTPRTVNA